MTSRSHTPLDIQKIQSGWRKRQISDDDDIQEYVRPWVGLTKNEVETLSYIAEGNTWVAVELAEAKLKEKNT
jgi:hypothetical protein